MSFITHNDDGGVAASMGDFLVNKLGPFMQNHALWVANRSPAVLTLPEAELYTHAGTVGTPARPYVFMRSIGRNLLIGVGTGIDTAEEWFDQPGNPGNSPVSATYSTFEPPTSFHEGSIRRSQMQVVNNTIAGAFAGHYLFTDGDGDTIPGTYVHAAIQLAAKEWRHLWVGNMTKYGTFTGGQYVCGHYHKKSNTGTAVDDDTANVDSPYSTEHIPPHAITGHTSVNATSTGENGANRGPMFEAEGIRTGVEWFGSQGGDSGGEVGPIGKSVGTINAGTEQIGNGAIVGGGDTIGSALFFCEPNLSAKARPLIPLVFMVKTLFESQERWGPIGQIPDCFRASIRGFSPNESFTLGSDTYRIYPLVNEDSTVGSNKPYSGYEGIVYKVVPAAP